MCLVHSQLGFLFGSYEATARPPRKLEALCTSLGARHLLPSESAAPIRHTQVAPRTLDFGRVSTAQPALAHFVVTNALQVAVHVALDLAQVPELAGSAPQAQVLPAGATGKFPVTLRARELRTIREACELCINGTHFAPLEVGLAALWHQTTLIRGAKPYLIGAWEAVRWRGETCARTTVAGDQIVAPHMPAAANLMLAPAAPLSGLG